jgi:hypothetical protein
MEVEDRYPIEEMSGPPTDLLAERDIDESQVAMGTGDDALEKSGIVREIVRGRVDKERVHLLLASYRLVSPAGREGKHGDSQERQVSSQGHLHLSTFAIELEMSGLPEMLSLRS